MRVVISQGGYVDGLNVQERNAVNRANQRFSLSPSEQTWLFDQLVKSHLGSMTNWDHIDGQIADIFDYFRDHPEFQYDGKGIYDVAGQIGRLKLKEEAANFLIKRPWASAITNGTEPETIATLSRVDTIVENGVTTVEANWIVGLANAAYPGRSEYLAQIINRARREWNSSTKENLAIARTMVDRDLKYQDKVETTRSSIDGIGKYISQLTGGWTVYHLNAGATGYEDIDDPIRVAMDEVENLVEEKIREYDSDIYVIKDANGVPLAMLEAQDYTNDPSRINVYNATACTEEAKAKLKEFVRNLKVEGKLPIYSNEPVELEDLSELADFDNEFGIIPYFSIVGSDEDDYRKAIDTAYNSGWDRGSNWYRRTPSKQIDAIIEYASERRELDIFEKAAEDFAAWADDQFREYMDMNSDAMSYPNEEDFATEKEAEDAINQYYENEKVWLEEFEPAIFVNMIFTELKRIRERDKTYYKQRSIKDEEQYLDDNSRQIVDRIQKAFTPDHSILDLEDDQDTFASGETWLRRSGAKSHKP